MGDQRLKELIRIADLIKKSWFSKLSVAEQAELAEWENRSASNRELAERLRNTTLITEELLELERYDTEKVVREVFSSINLSLEQEPKQTPVIPIQSLQETSETPVNPARKWYGRVAAAVLLISIASGIYFISANRKGPDTTAVAQTQLPRIEPGGNKATLTLDDGTLVVLDNSDTGTIADQGPAQVIKLDEGKLAYQKAGRDRFAGTVYNTISTPRGGQYQVQLPDGSNIWLNSASSIRFPVNMDGEKRTVQITGEVYLEVSSVLAADKKTKSSFVVELPQQTITVLGTRFNVNAYEDEEAVKTTLVEGSVLLNNGVHSQLIKPGEQAILTSQNTPYKINYPNMDEVLAWKNGRFLFRNTNAGAILRQFARWYDVDVEYRDNVSDILFSGGISRKDKLDQLIELLELDGRINLQLEGRKLIVSRTGKQ